MASREKRKEVIFQIAPQQHRAERKKVVFQITPLCRRAKGFLLNLAEKKKSKKVVFLIAPQWRRAKKKLFSQKDSYLGELRLFVCVQGVANVRRLGCTGDCSVRRAGGCTGQPDVRYTHTHTHTLSVEYFRNAQKYPTRK